MATDSNRKTDRRSFIKGGARAAGAAAFGSLARPSAHAAGGESVWQLDPEICVQCGRCADECVLEPSAVKCVHAFEMCGYCELCFGYFLPGATNLDEAAENQACPTGAISRRFIEEPYFEYTIDEELCIGCGKCVKGCGTFGNGSLFLQVRHDRCINCNQCAIALACPSDAFRRVPASDPYILKGRDESAPGGSSE